MDGGDGWRRWMEEMEGGDGGGRWREEMEGGDGGRTEVVKIKRLKKEKVVEESDRRKNLILEKT